MDKLIKIKTAYYKNPVFHNSSNEVRNLVKLEITAPTVDTKTAKATNIILILDVSGSMNAPQHNPALNMMKKAAKNLVNKARDGVDKIGIIFFNNEPYCSGTQLQPKKGDMKKFIDAIDAIEASGGTQMLSAFDEAKKQFDKVRSEGDKNNCIVVVMTDGEVNDQPFSTVNDQGYILPVAPEKYPLRDRLYAEKVKMLTDKDIKIRCVPLIVGDVCDPQVYMFLKDVIDSEKNAKKVVGQATSSNNIEAELSNAFASLFDYATNIVAKNLRIKIDRIDKDFSDEEKLFDNFYIKHVKHAQSKANIVELENKNGCYVLEDILSGEQHSVFVEYYSKLTPDAAPQTSAEYEKRAVLKIALEYEDCVSNRCVNKFELVREDEDLGVRENLVVILKYTAARNSELKNLTLLSEINEIQILNDITSTTETTSKTILNDINKNHYVTNEAAIIEYEKCLKDYSERIHTFQLNDGSKKRLAAAIATAQENLRAGKAQVQEIEMLKLSIIQIDEIIASQKSGRI